MKQSGIYRQNAENCAYLAEGALNEPTRQWYKLMEAAWSGVADEHDWIDGAPSLAARAKYSPAQDALLVADDAI